MHLTNIILMTEPDMKEATVHDSIFMI
jgi:hypothetical protein